MYIRRKVFSILADEMGEERLYSVNETLLEDYEYEERDFADSEEDIYKLKEELLRKELEAEYKKKRKRNRRLSRAAALATVGTGLAAANGLLGNKAAKYINEGLIERSKGVASRAGKRLADLGLS